MSEPLIPSEVKGLIIFICILIIFGAGFVFKAIGVLITIAIVILVLIAIFGKKADEEIIDIFDRRFKQGGYESDAEREAGRLEGTPDYNSGDYCDED